MPVWQYLYLNILHLWKTNVVAGLCIQENKSWCPAFYTTKKQTWDHENQETKYECTSFYTITKTNLGTRKPKHQIWVRTILYNKKSSNITQHLTYSLTWNFFHRFCDPQGLFLPVWGGVIKWLAGVFGALHSSQCRLCLQVQVVQVRSSKYFIFLIIFIFHLNSNELV